VSAIGTKGAYRCHFAGREGDIFVQCWIGHLEWMPNVTLDLCSYGGSTNDVVVPDEALRGVMLLAMFEWARELFTINEDSIALSVLLVKGSLK